MRAFVHEGVLDNKQIALQHNAIKYWLVSIVMESKAREREHETTARTKTINNIRKFELTVNCCLSLHSKCLGRMMTAAQRYRIYQNKMVPHAEATKVPDNEVRLEWGEEGRVSRKVGSREQLIKKIRKESWDDMRLTTNFASWLTRKSTTLWGSQRGLESAFGRKVGSGHVEIKRQRIMMTLKKYVCHGWVLLVVGVNVNNAPCLGFLILHL